MHNFVVSITETESNFFQAQKSINREAIAALNCSAAQFC